MSETSPDSSQPRVLDFWREGEVWFREFLPEDRPWADESLLEEVPEGARGNYGVKIADYATVDGQRYEPGQIVVVDGREELRRLVTGLGRIRGLVVPWYDRIVPPSLWLPHRGRIDLANYRRGIGRAWVKSFLLTAGLVAAGFAFPQFLFLALLAAMMYGLFPLVESSMAWMRRVDRYSIEELNERLVNTELFQVWMVRRPTGDLKIALGLLVAVYLGQLAVDLGTGPRALPPSIEAAALLREKVMENGEWWRVVTTGLMHTTVMMPLGAMHILFNGMALFSLGRVVSALVNSSLLAIVFLVAVVTGSLGSLWFGIAPASVGASGGLLGCLGFLLVVTQKFRAELPGFLQFRLIQSTIVVSIFGLLGVGFIDNAAHAGGFLGGLLLGAICWPWLRLASSRIRPLTRLAGWAAVAVLLAGAAKVGWEIWQVAAG